MGQPIPKPILDAKPTARNPLGIALLAERMRVVAIYTPLRALITACAICQYPTRHTNLELTASCPFTFISLPPVTGVPLTFGT